MAAGAVFEPPAPKARQIIRSMTAYSSAAASANVMPSKRSSRGSCSSHQR